MGYSEQPPPARLADSVACVWSLNTTSAIHRYPVPPDGCVDVLYDRTRSTLRAVGAMTRAQTFRLDAGACLCGVRFRPGMAKHVLGVSTSHLTDRDLSLTDLWPKGASSLKQALDDARTPASVAQAFINRLPSPGSRPNSVQQAIRFLVSTAGTANLDNLASQANLSPRQFRRRCLEESGLTPKLLARILRFQHASRLARKTSSPVWSDIAAHAGYFDQSHLIRDFHNFMGQTPVSVLSNTIGH